MVYRRSDSDIAAMRLAGRVVAEMHDACRSALRPGITTGDLDRIARRVLERRGATSNFLGYHGFPAVICASVNDEVVHGIPGPRVLTEGDIISIDCGAIVDGWHGDGAFTAGVGEISSADAELIEATRLSLDAGIAAMIAGNTLGDIGFAVESTVAPLGFAVLRDYVGHGIGRAMHEAPDVPNYGQRGKGRGLRTGHVLAVEPMVVAGSADTVTLADGWTVVTTDGARAAHWEHTIAVTDAGPQVLTLP